MDLIFVLIRCSNSEVVAAFRSLFAADTWFISHLYSDPDDFSLIAIDKNDNENKGFYVKSYVSESTTKIFTDIANEWIQNNRDKIGGIE